MCWDKHASSSSACFIVIIVASMVACMLSVRFEMLKSNLERAIVVVLLSASCAFLTGANLHECC